MKRGEELTRHQVLLYKGDFDKLSDIYRRRRATEVIRRLVRQHLNAIEERVTRVERLSPEDVFIEEAQNV